MTPPPHHHESCPVLSPVCHSLPAASNTPLMSPVPHRTAPHRYSPQPTTFLSPSPTAPLAPPSRPRPTCVSVFPCVRLIDPRFFECLLSPKYRNVSPPTRAGYNEFFLFVSLSIKRLPQHSLTAPAPSPRSPLPKEPPHCTTHPPPHPTSSCHASKNAPTPPTPTYSTPAHCFPPFFPPLPTPSPPHPIPPLPASSLNVQAEAATTLARPPTPPRRQAGMQRRAVRLAVCRTGLHTLPPPPFTVLVFVLCAMF